MYVISQLPTAAAMASFAVISTELFIPIMGRASNSINPDLAIGILTAAFVITISIFSVGCASGVEKAAAEVERGQK